ncbi:MAG: tetratricopeptide repeat protein [Myxococcota bacterium]|nr:tetratricopeptide repeat protein [Myxococcota bacterium]
MLRSPKHGGRVVSVPVSGWIRRAWLLVAMALVSGCVPGGATGRAQRQAAAGDLAGAQAALEQQRDRQPRSVDVRVALGETYYRIARDALDRGHDEARYLAFLERSVDEFVTAAELDPRDERPHFYLAMMDVYRGDLRRAMRGFDNARRLAPTGISYTNIAEIYVYLGRPDKARRWNELGLRRGAPYGAVLFNDMLIAWREGDVDKARALFTQLRRQDPEMIRNINVARLPTEPRVFEDFAGYCCRSPACGPYMKDACTALSLEVGEREISEEAVLRELRIEMERARRLREVYEQRKELEIKVEDAPPQ